LHIFLIQTQVLQKSLIIKAWWRKSRNRIFRSPKCRKWTLRNTKETCTQIKLSS